MEFQLGALQTDFGYRGIRNIIEQPALLIISLRIQRRKQLPFQNYQFLLFMSIIKFKPSTNIMFLYIFSTRWYAMLTGYRVLAMPYFGSGLSLEICSLDGCLIGTNYHILYIAYIHRTDNHIT